MNGYQKTILAGLLSLASCDFAPDDCGTAKSLWLNGQGSWVVIDGRSCPTGDHLVDVTLCLDGEPYIECDHDTVVVPGGDYVVLGGGTLTNANGSAYLADTEDFHRFVYSAWWGELERPDGFDLFVDPVEPEYPGTSISAGVGTHMNPIDCLGCEDGLPELMFVNWYGQWELGLEPHAVPGPF